MAKYSLAILGAGAAGTLLAIHTLRKKAPGEILIIEPSPKIGAGIAYRTEDPLHLLNVPSARMSAFEASPGHFADWLDQHAHGHSEFVPRGLYGRYLVTALEEESAKAPKKLSRIRDSAVSVEPPSGEQPARVLLSSGAEVSAERVVVATGHHFMSGPPSTLESLKQGEYIGQIWGPDGLVELLSRDQRVLILGTGLTMVDAVLSLVSRGHRGKITALSRRGLLPQTFRSSQGPPSYELRPGMSLREISRDLISQARALDESGQDWRSAVDSLRGSTPRLWAGLPLRDQERFLRHLRPFWDSHRHRLQPDSAERLHEIVAWRKLELKAGRMLSSRRLMKGKSLRGIRIEYFSRTLGTPAKLEVDVVLNCMGPESDWAKQAPALVTHLLQQGLAQLEPNHLGLKTDAEGRLLDRDSRPQDWLATLGPLRRGALWESTAIPEIRAQAEALARLWNPP